MRNTAIQIFYRTGTSIAIECDALWDNKEVLGRLNEEGRTMPLQVKRIYEAASPGDGKRILVDHIWPQGVSKEKADLFAWYKDLAPSDELRIWFDHIPARFAEFKTKYEAELAANVAGQAQIDQILAFAKDGMVTLCFAASDVTENNAVVLLAYLQSKS
jgi:uncharacterized protein YeaO (DUF488 family)